MFEMPAQTPVQPFWTVGDLCHAVADALAARFNPVCVRGEISGYSRAASGHCYFSIKDADGQIRCAMFRRAASLLDFSPRDGDSVELRGRLGVYEQRGDLQLIVEELSRAGQGALFERFLRLKAKLEEEGLFDSSAKRPLPVVPRGIGLVTSLGAAALHDVVSALRRRVPHIPVYLAPALVQGAQAPASIVLALEQLYTLAEAPRNPQGVAAPSGKPWVDVILLVRGGGSLEDLWAFNDESVARAVVRSPVPLICGVGHETDFSIADFCADLRAPTPTAAAELVSAPRDNSLAALQRLRDRLENAAQRQIEQRELRIDHAAARLGRPSAAMQQQQVALAHAAQSLKHALLANLQLHSQSLKAFEADLSAHIRSGLHAGAQRLDVAGMRLQLLDPSLMLRRGYAMLQSADGEVVRSVRQAPPGTALRARLADGSLDITVVHPRLL